MLTTVKIAMELATIPYLLLVGALLAVQAAANVQLAAATGSPFGASALQLGLGAALLLALAVDRYGLLRLPPRPISRVRLTGVAVLALGVAGIQAG